MTFTNKLSNFKNYLPQFPVKLAISNLTLLNIDSEIDIRKIITQDTINRLYW